MAWDKTLPANATKIRNYPAVLTANFTALEEADSSLQQWKINLIQRNAIPSAPPVTPAKITNVIQVYAKQSIFSRSELFVTDDHSTPNTIQLTQDGKIGAQGQDVRANNYFYGADTLGRGSWASPTIVGRISASGTVQAGSQGIASVTLSGSVFTVNFSASRITNTNYMVLVTPERGSSNPRFACWENKSTSSVDVRVVNQNGTLAPEAFDIVIFGGR